MKCLAPYMYCKEKPMKKRESSYAMSPEHFSVHGTCPVPMHYCANSVYLIFNPHLSKIHQLEVWKAVAYSVIFNG